MRHRRKTAPCLLLASAALLPGLHGSAGAERSAPLGVSLQIVAGCSVSSTRGTPILIACTNQVPYQLGVVRATGGAAAIGAGTEEPQVAVTPEPGSDGAVNVIVVTY